MEDKLYRWYKEYCIDKKCLITSKMIKKKALEYSSSTSFCASKGWLEKFKKKYKLQITKEITLKKHKKANSELN